MDAYLIGESSSEKTPVMASIAEQVTGERMARMVLSMIAEPDDPAAGHVLARVGGVQTLALIENNEPIPGMDRVEAMVWRGHLAPRLDQHLTAHAAEAEGRGIGTLIPADPEWPAGLNDLGVRTPYVWWTRGATSLLTSPLRERVTVTGARAATAYGMRIASDLAANLADDERGIVAGGAFGIEGAAHRGALARGGHTVAVLAGGVDRAYPSAHRKLLERIGEVGLLVSELPPGATPSRQRFLARVNNARVMNLPERETTKDGFEMTFGTNHLGHFAFDAQVWPAVRRSPAARVVTVSAIAARWRMGKLTGLISEQRYRGIGTYAKSKRADIVYTIDLARRLRGTPIEAVVIHPGPTMANLQRHSGGFLARALTPPARHLLMGSPEGVAWPSLYAATSPDVRSGQFIGPAGRDRTSGTPKPARLPKDAGNPSWAGGCGPRANASPASASRREPMNRNPAEGRANRPAASTASSGAGQP